MLTAERQPAGKKLWGSDLKDCCNNQLELADHVQQLIDAGFLDGSVHPHDNGAKIIINRIKNPGHDFLQAVREDTIWKKVKEKVMIPAGSWTLGLALEYAKNLLRERLGLP